MHNSYTHHVFSGRALRHTLALINCQCYCLAGNKRRQGDRMLSAICEHCESGSWRTPWTLSPRIILSHSQIWFSDSESDADSQSRQSVCLHFLGLINSPPRPLVVKNPTMTLTFDIFITRCKRCEERLANKRTNANTVVSKFRVYPPCWCIRSSSIYSDHLIQYESFNIGLKSERT